MRLTKLLSMSALTLSISIVSPYAMEKDSFSIEEKLKQHMTSSPQELYEFAIKLRKGEVAQFDKEETKKAAFLCFSQVFLKSENDKILWGRAAHNLGNLYCERKEYQLAAKMYVTGASTGLTQSENNLKKLQQLNVLPKAIQPNLELAHQIEGYQQSIAKSAIDIIHIMDEFEKDLIEKMPEAFAKIFTEVGSKFGIENTPKLEDITSAIKTISSNKSLVKQSHKKQLDHLFLSQVAQDLTPLQKLKEKARMTGIQRSDIDQYTYEELLTRNFTKQEIAESLFSKEALLENDRVAKKLKEILDPKTLPIVIGRSCEWIMEHFQRRFPSQPFVKLPGSGLYNINRLNDKLEPMTPDSAIEEYKKFLQSFDLSTKVFVSNQYHSITLIDRTESGDSILALATLLQEIDPRFSPNKINFIGVISHEIEKKFNFPTIVVNNITLQQTVQKHDFDQAKALSRSFDWPNWKNWRTFDFYPAPLAPAQARLTQVEMFCTKNN